MRRLVTGPVVCLVAACGGGARSAPTSGDALRNAGPPDVACVRPGVYALKPAERVRWHGEGCGTGDREAESLIRVELTGDDVAITPWSVDGEALDAPVEVERLGPCRIDVSIGYEGDDSGLAGVLTFAGDRVTGQVRRASYWFVTETDDGERQVTCTTTDAVFVATPVR